MLNKKGQTEDYFADFGIGMIIIVVSMWILSSYNADHEINEIDEKIKDMDNDLLFNFLKMPANSEKEVIKNLDNADAIMLGKKELVDYSLIVNEIKDRGFCFFLYSDYSGKRENIGGPFGERVCRDEGVKEEVVYLPRLDGGKIKVELILKERGLL